MNIKIITCHDVYNYGASLQAYALQTYLKQKGHDVEIIDYLPAYMDKAYSLNFNRYMSIPKMSPLYKYKDKGDRFLFLTGTLLGGAYEYFCSVFTELVFGKVFWDYSKIPFNLGGRINLLYCFFWGIAAVVWFKILFPPVEKWIEKIPAVAGKILTWVLLGFMVCNILVSCVALVRYDERGNGVQATNAVQKWADAHYDDAKMKKIYPNAKGIN